MHENTLKLQEDYDHFSRIIGQGTSLIDTNSLSEEKLMAITDRLNMQIEAFKMPSPQEQLYFFMFKKNLRFFDEDFFDKINDTDIVEVYDVNTYEQQFANNVFFQFSNYDAMTLMTRPFPQLYKRDKKHDSELLAMVQKAVHTKHTIECNVKPHVITEFAFDQSDRYRIRMKYITPLKNEDGDVRYVVSTNFCLKV